MTEENKQRQGEIEAIFENNNVTTAKESWNKLMGMTDREFELFLFKLNNFLVSKKTNADINVQEYYINVAKKTETKEQTPENEKIVLMSKFSPKPYADKIMENHIFLADKFGRFWRYDNLEGIWKENADSFIRNMLRCQIFGDEEQKKHYVDEVISYIRDITWTGQPFPDTSLNLIAFKNCVYDLETDKTLDFNSDFYLTNKIDIPLKDKNECALIDKFLGELSDKEILYQLMAYCLYRSYPYQKIFILYGSGENGKTTFLSLIARILGEANVVSETPQALVNERFTKGRLRNKMANISSDIPYTILNNVNVLKELCGGDILKGEDKFKNAVDFVNYSKQLFSANELPQVNDKTFAFYRRIYLIPFCKRFEKVEPFILTRITSETELSGLAWKLIETLKELKSRNFVFSHNPSAEETEKLYEDLSNPLNRFLREHTIQTEGASVFKYEFNDRFLKFLRDNGLRIWTEREINSVMAFTYQEVRRESKEMWDDYAHEFKTKHYRAWEGLKWK